MIRLILLAVVLSVGCAVAGWRGRFDEQFAAASTAEWTPASLNPIAWYKGDGNALDAMGNYDGTWYGTEAYADGPTGQAFDFNGNSWIGLGANFNFADTENFSFSTWIKAEAVIGALYTICAHYGYKINKRAWRLIVYNGKLALQTAPGGGPTPIAEVIGGAVGPNIWTHVAATVSGVNATLYVNGVGVSGIVSARYDTGGDVLTKIGAVGNVSADFWAGKISDVLIFDRALTAEEVEKLYNESINKDGAAW